MYVKGESAQKRSKEVLLKSFKKFYLYFALSVSIKGIVINCSRQVVSRTERAFQKRNLF